MSLLSIGRGLTWFWINIVGRIPMSKLPTLLVAALTRVILVQSSRPDQEHSFRNVHTPRRHSHHVTFFYRYLVPGNITTNIRMSFIKSTPRHNVEYAATDMLGCRAVSHVDFTFKSLSNQSIFICSGLCSQVP